MACVRILDREQSAWVERIDPQAEQTLKTEQDISNACLFYLVNKNKKELE